MVSDRQVAARVLAYFKDGKIGTANCKIVAELRHHETYVQALYLTLESSCECCSRLQT